MVRTRLAARLAELPPEVIQRLEAANREALCRMVAAQPVLVDVMALGRFDPGLGGRMTHAGPPVTPERMAGGMRSALMAAACYEGWTKDLDEALRMLTAGEIELVSNHDRGGVGGVARVLSPSMQVYVVADRVVPAVPDLDERSGREIRGQAIDGGRTRAGRTRANDLTLREGSG
jgi:hypothetical protein